MAVPSIAFGHGLRVVILRRPNDCACDWKRTFGDRRCDWESWRGLWGQRVRQRTRRVQGKRRDRNWERRHLGSLVFVALAHRRLISSSNSHHRSNTIEQRAQEHIETIENMTEKKGLRLLSLGAFYRALVDDMPILIKSVQVQTAAGYVVCPSSTSSRPSCIASRKMKSSRKCHFLASTLT